MNMMTSKVEEQKPLEAIVTRILAGEEQGFDELVERTHKLVRKIAAPLLPASAVDDAVQETYIIVYRKFHHVKEPKAFLGWLSRIALNVCYQWRRKEKPTEELKPEQAVEVVSSKLDVRGALEELKQKDRNILILREFLGLSYEEISEATELPEGTVRSRLHYARKKLRELLTSGA